MSQQALPRADPPANTRDARPAAREDPELPRRWRLMLTAGWNLAESLVLPAARYLAGAAGRGRAGTKLPARGSIALQSSGPAQPRTHLAGGWLGLVLLLAITAVAAGQYATGPAIISVAWLAVGPLLASLVLSPQVTASLAGWALLLAAGLGLAEPRRPGMLVSHLCVCLLLVAFAVINSALRTMAQRRLSQVRAVARVAQSALLREVPEAVTAARLASRYVSAAAEARVGGDLLEVVPDAARPRWLIGDTRGKGLPAVRLASVAMTSFRDACAQPGLDLPEIARVVDRSITRAASEEDFVTAVFAELDPGGWLQLVTCGHPPPLLLAADGGLRPLSPRAYAAPLGLHPDMQPSTFAVHAGDRLLFYTDGLLEARDKAGRYFRPEDCQDALRDQDLQAAADGLLDRLAAHAGRRLDDDVALLLVEIAVPPAGNQQGPASALAPGSPAVAGHRTPV
jgi:phosphoserine phosphatase RsbU/P